MIHKVLNKISLFKNISEDDLKIIDSKLISKIYSKHDVILFEDDTDQDLYLINSGTVKITQINFEGNEVIISKLGEGEFFGEMAIITQEARSANVVALEETEIYKLPSIDFKNALKNHSGISICMLEKIAKRLKESSHRINELSLNYAESRIAISLIKTAQKEGIIKKKHVIIDGLQYKNDLATAACTTTKIVTQTIENFKKQGIIAENDSQLMIFDFDKFIEDFS